MVKEKTGVKNIIFVENGIGYGGAIICLRHLVRNLDKEKYFPVVVTGRTGPEYEEISAEADWRHIPDRNFDVVGMKDRLEKSPWFKNRPVFYRLANQVIARLDDLLNFTPFFVRFVYLVHQTKAEIIHVNNEPLCNRAAILAGKLLGRKVVCHVRGEAKGSALMRWFYRLPDHFIPVSNWISKGIGELGISEAKRTVVYDGIALEKLNLDADGKGFRHQFHIPEDAFAVGLVGLLIPWKGQEIFLDAAKALAAEIPSLKMVIVGGTPEDCKPFEKKLKDRVDAEGLKDTVIFTGHVSDMPTVYNGLDVVVSASTSPEPLGTVVIESMAMGRPLVAPAHGGAAEMCDPGVNALLFTPRDANSLAEAIKKFFFEAHTREALGQAAREKAFRTFSVECHVDNVQKIYEKLLL